MVGTNFKQLCKLRRVRILDKTAIIVLDTTKVKLVFANVTKNKSFSIYDNVEVPINLMKDFSEENVIKSTIVKEVVGILSVFKKMIDKEGVTESICVATSKINEAKNQNEEIRLWVAHHILEHMNYERSFRKTALKEIRRMARTDKAANGFGEKMWLKDWYKTHPKDRWI